MMFVIRVCSGPAYFGWGLNVLRSASVVECNEVHLLKYECELLFFSCHFLLLLLLFTQVYTSPAETINQLVDSCKNISRFQQIIISCSPTQKSSK